MKTYRYKIEIFDQVYDLLKNTNNMVNFSTDLFFEIYKLFEKQEVDKEKVSKLFAKAYTVVAEEDGNIVGIASMDKEGNVGIFCLREGDTYSKAGKLIANALARRTEKRENQYIFVVPNDGAESFFYDQGYLPFVNGIIDETSDDSYLLAKEISYQAPIDINHEEINKITLDPKKKITVEGIYTKFPVVLLLFAVFFVALFVIITVTSYDKNNPKSILSVGIVVGIFALVSIALIVFYLVRNAMLKKKILSMSVTNGIITSLISNEIRYVHDRQADNYGRIKNTIVNITYVYYDENNQKHEVKYRHKYHRYGPYFYEGQMLVVAYSNNQSYILHDYTISNQTIEPKLQNEELSVARKVPENLAKEYVPLNAVQQYNYYATKYLCYLIFLLLIAVIISFIVSRITTLTFWNLLLYFTPLIVIGLILLGYRINWCFLRVWKANKKYNQLLNSVNSKVSDAKIVYEDKTFKADNKHRFYCEYMNGDNKKVISIPIYFVQHMVKRNDIAVKVIFNDSEELVLVKRGKYPDKFGRRSKFSDFFPI